MSLDADRVGHATRTQPADITHEVHDISEGPIAYGGFADIYSGIWKHDGIETRVAIKVLRIRTLDPASQKLLRQLKGEISVWKRLSHPNVHMLCGLCESARLGTAPAMVSPWYSNGDINAYVERHASNPGIDTLKLNLFFDVMAGLRFLHDNFIIHGDIKGGNVLISDNGAARLCDFGLSRLLWGSSQSIAHTGVKGTSRWMAPELILNDEVHSYYASDVWACGCLLIEVWSGVPPYHTKRNDQQVMIALSRGEPPARPSNMTDFPWSLVQVCCDFEPTHRPAPLQLMAKLAIRLTIPVIMRIVTRGRPLDTFSSELLRAIETSINTADSHLTAQLHSVAERDLAIEVVRILSLWSLGSLPEYRLYTDALYKWCLDTVVHLSQPVPFTDTRLSSGSNDEDENEEDDGDEEDGLIDPSKLRPFARVLAAVDPSYADAAMLRFARASVGTPIRFEDGYFPSSVVWFPDGDRIAVGFLNGTVDILSTSSGASIRRLNDHEGAVMQVAISPDGRLLASCSADATVRLWDAETGNTVGNPLVGHTSGALSVAFSPDGTYIASGSHDKTIRIWGCETCATVIGPLHGHTSHVYSLAYSPNGSRIVSGSFDNTIRVWDSRTGACILGPLDGHADEINSVAFSPDGLRFVSCSDDKTVRIWDAFSGEPVGAPMEGHRDSVTCVASSPDGIRIASGSHDCTIRIWDATTGASIHDPLREHGATVWAVTFSPDGRKLASAADDGTVRIWDATDEWTRWDI